MHHPTDRITHTTAFVTPVVEHWLEREIAIPTQSNPAVYGCTVWLFRFQHPGVFINLIQVVPDVLVLGDHFLELVYDVLQRTLQNEMKLNKQGLKRMLINETRQYNIQIFNKSIFLKERTKQIKATETNK